MQIKILCPLATEHCSNRSSTVEVDGLFTEHHAQFRETIQNGKVAPLTDVHYSVTMEGLPIAPTHATNKKADTKRYDRRCVRTFFDRMADIIVSIHRAVADRLGGI
jgi:hypothetical protein